jgi:hypothetical protein
MPLAGLILNRVHFSPGTTLSAARSLAAAENLDTMEANGYSVTAAALRLHAERMNLSDREQRVAGAFTSAHPAVPVAEVAALPVDVHDLAGLRRIGESLGNQG